MCIKKIAFYNTVIIGCFVGAYLSQGAEEQAKKTDRELMENIIQMVDNGQKPNELRESLIVRLANKSNITMYGRQVNDTLSDKSFVGRKKYELHPYGKAGVAASALVTYKDSKTGENYILLGRKYANPTNKSQGLAAQFIIPGGYMRPHPLEGAVPNIEDISDEEKDLAEEAILLGESGYNKIAKLSSNSKNEIKKTTVEDYDINLEATAIRELYEEAGILWNSSIPPKQIGVRSTYGITGDKRLHIVNVAYLFDFGETSSPPSPTPGSDIAALEWVKLNDIRKDYSMKHQEVNSKLSRYSVVSNGIKTPIVDALGEIIDQYASSIKIPLKESDSISYPLKEMKKLKKDNG